MTRQIQPSDYQRTRIIGFSVTHSMWPNFKATIPNPSAWELKWYFGGSVDLWADGAGVAWTYVGEQIGSTIISGDPTNTGGIIDPVGGVDNEAAVDRVVFNVSGLTISLHPPGGYSNDPEEFGGYLDSAIAAIKTHHPNVRVILLQPGLDGAGYATCPTQSTNSTGAGYDSGGFSVPYGVVRSSYNAGPIRAAIMRRCVGNVRAGWFSTAVRSCADFRDWSGHLQDSVGAPDYHGGVMATYYANHL